MKKTIFLIFVISCILTQNIAASTKVYVYIKTVSVVVNNKVIDTYGLILDNRTLVPLRGVFEGLGYSVTWDSNNKIAYFNSSEYLIGVKSDEILFFKEYKSTGIRYALSFDVPAQIINGSLYVPVRAISEALDANVIWDGAHYAVYIENNSSYRANQNNQSNCEYLDPDYKTPSEKRDEELDKLADEIIAQIIKPEYSELERVQAVHDYLVLNTKYDISQANGGSVPVSELNKFPYSVLKEHKGICTGYALAAKLLLERAGIEAIYVTGTGRNGSHAWNIVKVNNNYYHLDVTWDDPSGAEEDYICWDFFLKSDSTMKKNHTWSSDYPKCVSDYNFTPPFDYYERKYSNK